MNCLICLEKINNNFVYTNCNCKNILYHKECISNWLMFSLNCPHCKKIFPKSKYNKIKKDKIKIKLKNALLLDSIHKYNNLSIINNSL